MKVVAYTFGFDGVKRPSHLYETSSKEYKISTAIAELEALKTMLQELQFQSGDLDVIASHGLLPEARVDSLEDQKFLSIVFTPSHATT